MNPGTPYMPELELLLAALAEGELSPEQRERLSELMRSDRAAQRFYKRYIELHVMLEWEAGAAEQADPNLLQELADQEALAGDTDALDVNAILAAERRHRLGDQPDQPMTREDVASAAKYVFRKAIHSKAARFGAVAAAVVLGVVLLIQFIGPSQTPEAPAGGVAVAQVPTAQDVPIVAWVTESVNAKWRIDDKPVGLIQGSALQARERLTLVSGFAEITTGRGAIAFLQAPCTVELTDSDNALRLHRGRLVGKCQTARSKGFTVHAPGIDVVDLGTEFGVEADAEGGSTVFVMDGAVRAQPTPESPQAFEPVVIETSQARRVVPETGGLEMIAESEAPPFYRDRPHPYVTAVLNASPVAYWRFEEDRDGEVPNEVGPGRNNLDMFGPAGLTHQGVIGRAGRLINREEPYGFFETAKPVEALGGKEQFTVELWYFTDERYTIKNDNSTASLMVWYDPLRSSATRDQNAPLMIELLNDFWIGREDQEGFPLGWREDSIRIYPGFIGDTNPKRQLFSSEDYPVGRWQHLVIVNQGDAVKLYLDGRLVDSATNGLSTDGAPKIRLGQSIIGLLEGPEYEANQGDHRSLRGRLDEVAIYDRPLSAEEIANHYALATEGAP